MQNLPYDINNKDSIIAYAKQLVNKSLRDICDKNIITDKKNKGGYGQLLEKFYFLYEPNSDTEPDFKEAGLELKSSPIKKLKRLDYVSKERLVLNIINYLDIVNENFQNSSLLKKNKHLLLVFYLYEKNKKIVVFQGVEESPVSKQRLKGFNWLEKRRPKNRFDVCNRIIKSSQAHIINFAEKPLFVQNGIYFPKKR